MRKWSDAVDPTANKLIAVPGGSDGPGGVLVCSENFIVYKSPAQAERRCALPRRRDLPNEHGLLITASAVHRQRDLFFVLVQTEMGDLYKASPPLTPLTPLTHTLTPNPDGRPSPLQASVRRAEELARPPSASALRLTPPPPPSA